MARAASERDAIIAAGVRRREEHSDPATMRGVDRVEITVREGLSYEARNPHEPDGAMRIGEPVERGGDGSGASPLTHFLTGAGSCLLNQFVRVAITEGLPLRFEGASVRGEFRREAGGRMQRIACEVRASGSIDEATAAALMARAERLCYIHQTLVAVVEMTTSLVVDGRTVARHVDGPAESLSRAPVSPG
jgi:uncharacterized OsmC-like protein